MNTSRIMAGASHFAHFAGLARASRRATDDDDQNDQTSAGDDEDEDRMEEDDKPSDEEPKSKKGKAKRAAEDDGDDGEDEPKGKRSKRAAEDEEDGDEEPKARGKKARRAEDDDGDEGDDDDDKQEMTGCSAAASARRRERARCAAIFAHSAASGNVALAASLAFETTLTRREAVAVMEGQVGRASAPVSSGSSAREARNSRLGAEAGPPTGKQAIDSVWDRGLAAAGVKPAKR